MKYDIPTLLALSQNARQEIEKYRAQALGRNLVRQRKGNSSALSERSANRSREASNLSYHSEVTSVSGPSLRLPSRQPNNPPRGNLAQTDSGFARFLKEHSSPKHQRVTAGGRIIPMDPSTPAPKMKLPVKKADPKSCDGAANTIPHGEHHNKTQRKPTQSMEKEVNTSDNVKSSSLPAGVLVDQTKLFGGNGALGQYIQAQGVFSNLPSASMAPTMLLRPGVTLPLGNPVLQPEQQTQEYLKLLQNCAAYGVGDQFAWLPNTSQPMNLQNPTASFMPGSGQPHASVSGPSTEFSTCNSFVPMAPSVISSLSPGLDSFYSTFGATGVPFVGSQAPLLNQALPFQGATQGGVDVASVQGAAREYEVLSAQLSRLDRYMALHTWDLDPRSKKLLVEERMELVRDLDTMRLYKEQLESVFAQAKSGSAESEKRSNIRSPAGQLPLGDFTSNQTAQMARFSAPNTSNVPATLSGPTLTAGFQQMSMNDPFHATLQWPSKGNLYSLDTGLGLGDLPANSELYETDASYYDEGSSKAPGPDKQDVQFPATESTDAERSCCDGWATPTKSVPTDISRIYRRVEEATKRGVPIDSLLQELAAVTTRLVRQVSEERNVSHLALNPGGKMAVNSNGPVSSAAAPSRHVLHAQPRSHAIGRLWRSEGLAQASANSPGNTPYETDEEDGAESCSSSSSTTNSWATIQEGDKQWHTAEVLNEGSNERHKDRLLKGNQVPLGHAAPVNVQAPNLRDQVGSIHKTNVDTTARKPSAESTKQSCPQRLTQYFDKEPGLNLRKSAALAVSQSVTAHAFLPPFDGGWDSPSLESYPDDSTERSEDNPTSTHEPNQWYMQKERVKPSPAAIREFFSRIEEEERSMIQRYQMMDPTPWQLG